MSWARLAEVPGEAKQTTWMPLPEPRSLSDLRSHWKLFADGRDYSGNDGGCNQDGRPGQCSIGAGGGPGMLPASTYFPGGGNCFRSGSGSATAITIPITGAHWVYPTAGSQGCGFLNHFHNSTHIPFVSVLGTYTTGGVWCVGAYHLSSGHSWISSNYAPPVNTWSWLCWTIDAARAIRTYVNGTLTATGTLAYVPLGSDQDVFIGARWDGAAFVGYACDFRLYNKAISQAEVTEIYQRTTNTLPAPPVWVPLG
jgi:Concanavalin A-like lectin/glucanases superfamily